VERDLSAAVARDIVARLQAFDTEDFWAEAGSSDGLAVFVAPDHEACFRLPAQFPELQVVGPTFHTKPLIRFLQASSLSYHLLALNVNRVILYEGLGDSIQEVPLRGVPLSLEAFEAGEATDSRGSDSRGHHGPGGSKEHGKLVLEKFFRAVARDLWKNHLRTSARGLILAAPPQHQALFRKVAQIPTLLEAGVAGDPARMSPAELQGEARRVLEPEVQRRIQKAKEEFGFALSRSQASDGLRQVAEQVAAGRVRLLFVESGRRVWGLFNPETGEVAPGDATRNAYDVDLLDELAEQTIVKGGDVFILRKEDMPTQRGVAAIYRF
jgi:hypothetical protein